MASGVIREGLLTHLWNHYLGWSGRYSGNALYAIYPILFGMFDGLIYLPVLLLSGLAASAAFFLSQIFRVSITSRPVIIAAVCFVGLYLLGMKHTASSLFWPAGALSYQTANILFLVFTGLLIKFMDCQQLQLKCTLVVPLLGLVIIIAMGTNETNLLITVGVMFSLFILQIRRGWKILKPWVLLLIITIICFLIVYLAPGNAIRESTFPLRHHFTRSMDGSLQMGAWVLTGWLLNPSFIIISLLSPFAIKSLSTISGRKMYIPVYWVISLLLLTLSIPVILQFPAWWAMGGWPPPRTVDAIYFIFLLSWFISLGLLGFRYVDAINVFMEKKPAVYILFILTASYALSVFADFKFHRVLTDLNGRAESFDGYMQQRYKMIEQSIANGNLALQVPAFNKEYPRSIYFNDIVPDYRDWRNVCYAQYFGLQYIQRDRQQLQSDHKILQIKPQDFTDH